MPKNNERNYQELQTELDEVMLKLQSSELDADEAVRLYEMGLKLVKELQARLDNAKNTVKKLQSDFGKG